MTGNCFCTKRPEAYASGLLILKDAFKGTSIFRQIKAPRKNAAA